MLLALAALTIWLIPIKAESEKKVTIHEPHAVQEIKPNVPSNPQLPITSNPQNVSSSRVDTRKSITKTESRVYDGRNYSKEEVQSLIILYASIYGIAPETPLCIAKLESGYNQFSANRHSTAKGIFQYLVGTWKATDEGKAGYSVFDADANVKAAVKYMAIHKSTKPWTVAPRCPKLTFLSNDIGE